MAPKKDTKVVKGGGKPLIPLKDLVPPSVKQPPRDPRPIKPNETHPMDKKPQYKGPQQPPDWPGDEQAKIFDLGVESSMKFTDSTKLKIPDSFALTSSQITFWRRPKEFLLDELESQNEENEGLHNSGRRGSNPFEVKPAPKSKFTKMRTSLYEEKKLIEDDIRVHSPKKRPKDMSVSIKVFGVIERLETEEEFEKRKKELEERKAANPKEAKKKPGKKEENNEDAPMMIKEVKLSNMDMSGYYPYFSKWLASQFQIIKDRNLRDAYTDKPIWSKIYPQQDGIPIYNKSGRYWVKLYYMGRERKIEVDDRMPTSVNNHCLFPRSVKKEEIWPMILSKAILKLNTLCLEGDQEYGDGSVLYALTGLIPETMYIPKMINPEEWKYINELMKDYHFLNNTAFVTCFCSSFYKPTAPSNKLTSDKEAMVQAITFEKKLNPEEDEEAPKRSHKINMTSNANSMSVAASPMIPGSANLNVPGGLDSPAKFMRKTSPRKNRTTIELPHITTSNPKASISKEKPTYVIPGFGYSIIEAFYTEGFNMVFVQKHSEQEIKLIEDYLELSKINIHKREKEEKLEIRRKRKELLKMIKEDAERRKELIEKPPILYKFFRVKTAIAKVPVLNIMTPFTPEEIFLAKKCVLNRLKCPPNYDLPDIKMTADDKSVYSQQISQSGEGNQIKPLDDFSTLPNIKDPMKRGVGGSWVLDRDFSSCFEYLQIFYSPTKLLHHKHISVAAVESLELTPNSDCEVIVVEESQDPLDPNALFQGNKVPFVLSFQACRSTTGPVMPPAYCIVQKFDFQSLEGVKNYKTLKDQLDSMHLLLENKNHVFRVMVNSPLGYSLWISSFNSFKHMSIAEYLMKYEGFSNKVCPVEYPALDKDRYHLFFKFKINNQEKDDSMLVLRIKSATESFLLRHLRFKLMDLKAFGKIEHGMEGVHIVHDEITQEVLDYNKFAVAPNTPYILLLESRVPFSCPEGNLEVELLFKGNFTIDPIETIDPVEYSDKYQVNKYGIIFRERLFCQEEVQASLFVRLTNLVAMVQSVQKSNKKPGNAPEADTNETDLTEKRLVLFELFENETLLTSTSGLNFAILSNVNLKSNKDESLNRNYYLQARFDLREFASCISLSEETKSIAWVLKVFVNEPVAFVRDTQKEDFEKAIKKAWEDKEPGRQEKAKKSRQKYMLFLKKSEGGVLTEAENELLNEPRMSKKQREEEALAKQNLKMKSPMIKGGDKKGAAGAKGKKEEPVVEEKKERVIPVSGNHRLEEVKDYLELMESERVVEERAMHGGLIDVRSKENKEELKEGFQMGKEDYMAGNRRNNENIQGIKNLLGEGKKQFLGIVEQRKKEFNDKVAGYTKERDEMRKAITSKKEKEKVLMDMGSNDKVNPEELEKLLKELEGNKDIEEGLLKWGRKVLVNAKINNMTEKLSNAVNGFDLAVIQACLEEIQKVNMGVDEDLIEKAGEIVEEAKNNPNYIQEKQAELKKTAGKKPAGKK